MLEHMLENLGWTSHDRVLILGASGWLGRTFLDLIPPEIETLAIASWPRKDIITWDKERVQTFSPTVVANFAFLTPDQLAIYGTKKYVMINTELSQRFLSCASMSTVRASLTISSGAAKTEPNSPYGSLKLREERQALDLIQAERSVVVARAYSVSGVHVRNPHQYAFSDLITQAIRGKVHVSATSPVVRRYVDAGDYLRTCTTLLLAGQSGVIDSGGEVTEINQLAEKIVASVNPAASITRASSVTEVPSIYASDNSSWQISYQKIGLTPLTLDEQIRLTSDALRLRESVSKEVTKDE